MNLTKCILIFSLLLLCQTSFSQSEIDSTKVSQKKLPEYPGGKKEMFMVIGRNMQIPEDNQLHGKIIVQLSIDETGKITASKIVKSLGDDVDKAALKSVKKLRNFIPAVENNIAIPSTVDIPINI